MSIGYGGDLHLGFLSGSLRGMEERAKDAFAGVVREPSAPGSFVASAVQLSVRNFPWPSEKQAEAQACRSGAHALEASALSPRLSRAVI